MSKLIDTKNLSKVLKKMFYNRKLYNVRVKGNNVILKYHDTDICTIDVIERFVKLDNGGWETQTTKRCMNKVLDLLNIDCGVHQKNFKWWVWERGLDVETPYKNGDKLYYNLLYMYETNQ